MGLTNKGNVCVMYVLCMGHVCAKGKSHWGQMERPVPLATPDSVGTEV